MANSAPTTHDKARDVAVALSDDVRRFVNLRKRRLSGERAQYCDEVRRRVVESLEWLREWINE